MAKRKVPVLNIYFDMSPKEGFEFLIKSPEIKDVILGELVNAISDSFLKKRKEASIFRIDHSDYTVNIKQEKWKISLSKALEFYVEKENWDMCIKCRDLISKL
jgi:hypothetical protein